MNNLPPSFETPNSDCNLCFSFAGIFQWRVWKAMDVFHSYASCHISDIVPFLARAFFSLFIFCKVFSSLFSCGVDGHMLHFSFFCSLAWNRCLFEPWVDVSEKSFNTSLLPNSKIICSFKKDCLIFQIRERSFLIWGQGNTDSIFLLETLPETHIFRRQQPQYLLYRSFPLGLAGFQCSPRGLKKFSFLSSGISDLACSDYRAEES